MTIWEGKKWRYFVDLKQSQNSTHNIIVIDDGYHTLVEKFDDKFVLANVSFSIIWTVRVTQVLTGMGEIVSTYQRKTETIVVTARLSQLIRLGQAK